MASSSDKVEAETPAVIIAEQAPPSPTQTRDNVLPASTLRSPEVIHAQIPTYTPPQRSQTTGNEDGQARRPSSSYATGGTIELPQAVFPPARTLSTSSQHVPRSPEQKRQLYEEESDTKTEELPAVHEEQDEKPVTIKQEHANSPQDGSSADTRLPQAEIEQQSSKTLSSLKHEHASRTHSPLRESSLALPTTEVSPNPATMKKRPGPAKKKGTATAAKKPRGSTKKRKVDAIKASKGSKGTPAPSSPSRSASGEYDEDDDSDVDSDEDVEGSGDVYCLCRKPDNGTFMIGCDGGCDDWFHGKCVHIEERDKNLIDKYICPRCLQAGIGRTSWKRMCRRPACRQPARVGKNAGKNGETSKYCSDECGVLFFRQMTSQSRGAEHKERGRRKSGIVEDRHDDMGAKGGVLSVGEIRAMLDQTNSATEFRELGNGVLSPPATPEATPEADDMTELEKTAIQTILTRKEAARQRHQILKDRQKFITMIKNEAGRAAAEKELKAKDYCGFDPRLEWSEEEFTEWRQSSQGQQVFELDSLEPLKTEGEVAMQDVDSTEICSRKKCARHTEWAKLMVDEVRFEMTDNSDRMRSLEQEERDVRDRAATRAKALKFGETVGSVELHNTVEVNDTAEPMDVDPVA